MRPFMYLYECKQLKLIKIDKIKNGIEKKKTTTHLICHRYEYRAQKQIRTNWKILLNFGQRFREEFMSDNS